GEMGGDGPESFGNGLHRGHMSSLSVPNSVLAFLGAFHKSCQPSTSHRAMRKGRSSGHLRGSSRSSRVFGGCGPLLTFRTPVDFSALRTPTQPGRSGDPGRVEPGPSVRSRLSHPGTLCDGDEGPVAAIIEVTGS